jgi:UDP-2,4-diacetamido-2,4,6-trideoxy-beta-L-altropyranose hydrolase
MSRWSTKQSGNRRGLAVFRADASVQIGTGHLMRCLTLADALKKAGMTCAFISRGLTSSLVQIIRDRGHGFYALTAGSPPVEQAGDLAHSHWLGVSWQTDADECRTLIEEIAPSWIIVDHYALDARWETRVHSSGAKLMAIDDLADRLHAANMLLDQNLGRVPEDYTALAGPSCKTLTGPNFALLRPEFSQARQAGLVRCRTGPLRRIMVSMGGMDADNVTGSLLDAFSRHDVWGDLHFDIVMGGASPHLQSVRTQVAAAKFLCYLHVDVSDMPGMMISADLAIGGAGSTSWERCCLGLPTLLLVMSDNQVPGAMALDESGAARLLGDVRQSGWQNRIIQQIGDLSQSGALCDMSAQALQICDGRGAARIAEVVLDYTTPTGEPVGLRDVRGTDVDTLYAWQCDPVTRRHARVPTTPAYAEHTGWFKKRLAQAEWPMHFLLAGETPVGMVRLDPVAPDSQDCEVSILIAPDRHGQGLGRIALALLRLYYPDITVHAQVLPENRGSQRLFEAAGYQRLDDSNFVLRPRTPEPRT